MPPETTNDNVSNTLTLERVDDPSVLLPLLKERHPVSCLVSLLKTNIKWLKKLQVTQLSFFLNVTVL